MDNEALPDHSDEDSTIFDEEEQFF